MENLLTAKQVQTLLKVNRITIYRMLKDGRLQGVKIGQQWRFPYSQFEHLESLIVHNAGEIDYNTGEIFPVHCIQAIQNLYVELTQVGAITVDVMGKPITEVGRACEFCRLVLSSPTGKEACKQTWIEMASTKNLDWHVCHAGLYYRKTPICEENGKVLANFYSGQFHLASADKNANKELGQRIAQDHQINEALLLNALQAVPKCDPCQNPIINTWPQRFSYVIETILMERNSLIERLQRIVEIGTLTG